MKKQWILLILLLLFITTTIWIWLILDTQPPWWDQADYLRTSCQYAHHLQRLHFGGFFKDLIFFNVIRPPLVMLLTTPVYFFNYRNEDLAVMINVLFMVLTFLVIFKLSKEYLEPKAALLSCFILSMYPIIFQLTRTFMVDIGLMSMVVLSIYLLLKCDGFKSLKYSLLLGLSLGLGMLTKQSYPIFIVVPFICIVWKSNVTTFINKAKTGNPDSIEKALLNLFYCLLVAEALTLPWYGPNLRHTLQLLSYFNSAEFIAKYGLYYTWDIKKFLTYYPIIMVKYGISVFFAFLFLCSSIFFFRTPKFGDIKRVFIWLIVFPLIFFTFSVNKDIRFLVPLLPAVAIITAHGLYLIKNRLIKTIAIGLIVCVGMFQFFVYSFNIPFLQERLPKIIVWAKIVVFYPEWGYTKHPQQEEWKVEEVLATIKKDMKENSKGGATVIILSDHRAYNASTLNYYSVKKRLGLLFRSATWTDDVTAFMAKENYLYVIYKDVDAADINLELSKRRIDKAYAYLQQHTQEFMIIDKIRVFDGSHIVVYKRM